MKRTYLMNIDWTFISQLEGGQKLDGYYPGKVGSGVTVATGVDIGQRNLFELNRLNMSPDLKKKLEPYLGVKGDAARRLLVERPLKISKMDADQLDQNIKRDVLITFERLYDQEIMRRSGLIRLSQLPREIQTVIVSVVWQYGPNLKDPTVAPKYWKHITEQDWHAAEKELMNFGDEYTTRRQKEGRYLKQWLDRQPKP